VLSRSEGVAAFETQIEQGSTASQRAQKRPLCHAETAGHCGADRAFEKAKASQRAQPKQQGSAGQCGADCAFSLQSSTAMLLRRGEGCFFASAICPAVPCRFGGKTDVFEPFGWPLNLVLSQQMGHDLAALRAAFRPSLPCC